MCWNGEFFYLLRTVLVATKPFLKSPISTVLMKECCSVVEFVPFRSCHAVTPTSGLDPRLRWCIEWNRSPRREEGSGAALVSNPPVARFQKCPGFWRARVVVAAPTPPSRTARHPPPCIYTGFHESSPPEAAQQVCHWQTTTALILLGRAWKGTLAR